jgi:hypothetical protein
MRKLLLTATLVTCLATLVPAQRLDTYNRFEVFHGTSYFMLERPEAVGDGTTFEGFRGIGSAATFNIRRYFGVRVDLARYDKSYDLCAPGQGTADPSQLSHGCFSPLPGAVVAASDPHFKTAIYNFMGGIQLKDNGRGTKTFKPFAHLSIGSALTRASVDTYSLDPASGRLVLDFKTRSDWGAAGAVGGGLDIRLHDRIDLRVIQIDYHKATIFNSSADGLRVGVGLVFH